MYWIFTARKNRVKAIGYRFQYFLMYWIFTTRKDGQTTIDVKSVITPKPNIQQKPYIQTSIYTDRTTYKLQPFSFSASVHNEANSL
jgi:hypothetical protein